MYNVKIIAMATVAMLAVSGIGVTFWLLNQGDKIVDDSYGRLMIFGNANNDDYVDEDDVDYIKAVINGTAEITAFSDANQDGVVDEKDVEHVLKMIENSRRIAAGETPEKMTIYYLSVIGTERVVGSCDYPLQKVGIVGTDLMLTAKLIGAVDKIVCRSGGSWDDTLFSDVIGLYALSDGVFHAYTENVVQYMAENGGPGSLDAILTHNSTSYVTQYEDIENIGVKVIRIVVSDGVESIAGALTMGYLLGLEASSQEYAEFCEYVLGFLADKLEAIPAEERWNVISVTMSNYVSGLPSDYYNATVLAGGNNVADWPEVTKRFQPGDEWLYNYDIDYILHMRSVGYGYVDLDTLWEEYATYFTKTTAYINGNYYIINGNMPVVIRIIYMAYIMYPDLITYDEVADLHQYCVDTFLPNLAGYDVRTDGTFIVTIGMIT